MRSSAESSLGWVFLPDSCCRNTFSTLSMLIFLSIPSVFAVSHMAYNDLFVAFFTLAAFYSFLRWSEQGFTPWLILCGVFSGSAAACKYTALLLTPLGCLGILWFASRRKAEALPALRLLMLFAAAALIAGSPFYLKNWIMTGNPFHPFLYGIFGGRGWDGDQARLYDLFVQSLGMGRTISDYLLLPWNVSIRAKMDSPAVRRHSRTDLSSDPPFLAGLRRWETPVWLLLIYLLLTFLFWASSAQQIRYLIPLFPLLALLTGAIMTRYRNRKQSLRFCSALSLRALPSTDITSSDDFMKINPVNAAVGIESRGDFLLPYTPALPDVPFRQPESPAGSSISPLMKNFTFLCERDCYSDSMFEAHTLQKILQEERSAEVSAAV